MNNGSTNTSASWHDFILRHFTPGLSRLVLVADPDDLLAEEKLLLALQHRGFDLLRYSNPIELRYIYESQYRSKWDLGLDCRPLLVLSADTAALPADMLQLGRRLSFSLAESFPKLSYAAVAALNRADLDSLYQAQKMHLSRPLGENASKEFILRHVFSIVPELIKQSSDLLSMLLRRHYRGLSIPGILDEHLLRLLRQNKCFQDWPLESLLSKREAFFDFLQQRWPIFLDCFSAVATSPTQAQLCDVPIASGYALPAPLLLPFEHQDIRIYLDNLFAEGLLRSVPHEQAASLSETWVGMGIESKPGEIQAKRLGKLIDNLESSLPGEDARHAQWFHFARGWAELKTLSCQECEPDEEQKTRLETLREKLDLRFLAWIQKNYGGLIQLPPKPPVMLHQIPRFMASSLNKTKKLALLLIDGLALEQWLLLRKALSAKLEGLRFREQEVFAWIPSLTALSRQALFAGKTPLFFANSIHRTDKDCALWSQFWAGQNLAAYEQIYCKGLGEGGLDELADKLSQPRLRVAGLVVDKVDRIMHGMELGSAGMLNQIEQWGKQAYLSSLVELLLAQDFKIYLTSDHGNIEAQGCGKPGEAALADLRGERVRVYPNAALRSKVKQQFPEALEWGGVGLPEDYFALLAPARQAFVQKGKTIVGHGGVCIEEIIVPLVEIDREDK